MRWTRKLVDLTYASAKRLFTGPPSSRFPPEKIDEGARQATAAGRCKTLRSYTRQLIDGTILLSFDLLPFENRRLGNSPGFAFNQQKQYIFSAPNTEELYDPGKR
jgi:hypothetical protein